jgi:GTPase SAR1 family protein
MSDLRIYIPKALTFQRVAKSAIAAASQVDHGAQINDHHTFALLEFFEFLVPQQIMPLMGPGLAAELSAIIESEFALDSLGDRTPLQNLLYTHASVFVGLYCRDGSEEPRCYRIWLRFQEQSTAGSTCDVHACLMANFEVAVGLGCGSPVPNPKLLWLKHQMAARTAELLLEAGFRPETTLQHIRQDEVPKPAEILAMQALVQLKKSPDDLARLCAWAEGSAEAAFLCWASKDSFVGDALAAWGWLKRVTYDKFPVEWRPSEDHGSLLASAWREGKDAPAGLALREEPWTETDAEQPFPCLLDRDIKPRFSPVPLMLIGGSGVGKTAFLNALARRLPSAHGQLREGMHLESTDLQEVGNLTGEKSESATNTSTDEASSYNFCVRDEEDPEVGRWMRLQFTDYNGEQIARRTIAPDLLKNLRRARGLLFVVDERSFPDLLSNSGARGITRDGHKDAADLAARYTGILQRYFEVNKDALHLPVALVVNKADLLMGWNNLLSLNPPFLIPEDTKMELVHAGLQAQADATDPFSRLRCCIRYNLAISRNSQNQRLVFELIEQFKGFIAAAICHTYRFQIFLISSQLPKNEKDHSLPYGVWEVIKWMFNQIDPAYRLQAKASIERASSELEEMRILLSASVLRDHGAHIAYMTAVAQRQAMSKMRINILDRLLESRIEHASQRMQAALGDALALAELPSISVATDPAPFTLRRRVAAETLERLEYQITYLKQWLERLSGAPGCVPLCPETPKNEVVALKKSEARPQRERFATARRAG